MPSYQPEIDQNLKNPGQRSARDFNQQRGKEKPRELGMEFAELREVIEKLQVVDGHAHNIVSLDSSFPFIRCFTEAQGKALTDVPHTLCFKRSLRKISELYGCENSLQAVEEYRKSAGLESISRRCFDAAGIAAILIDDGLALDKKLNVEWHKGYAPYVGRILRIESLAEEILEKEMPQGYSWSLDKFTEIFVGNLRSAADKVAGLKSIAAYRSGLEINTHVTNIDAEEGLFEVLHAGRPYHITNKNFIDYIFTSGLEVAACFDLPMQIHTGFGDNDLDLRFSNPLHLRVVLQDKRFSKCRLVLLHASYPFSREASYLASIYPQVYIDFGLAIPKLSVCGMISSVKELLQLAPINKVMFSTDGYAFPETYYLGVKEAREVIFSVLKDACVDGDLSVEQAIQAAKDILAQNAINFYNIGMSIPSKEFVLSVPENIKAGSSANGISLVRVIWVDSAGQHRCKVAAAKHFNNFVKKNGIGLAVVAMAMSSSLDVPAEGSKLTAVGEIRLMPDLSTQQRLPWSNEEEMVLADMYLKPGEAWEYCPREALRRVLKVLKNEFNLEVNVGFENEFFILKNVVREGKEEWVPIDTTPYCSASGFDAVSPLFRDIVNALHSLNITVEMLHAEAGKGQFEVVLGHTACASAADNVVFARETIRCLARKHGLLATLIPKYALNDVGSGCHAHLSLWRNGENVFMASDKSSRYGMSTTGEAFMAGVLDHLPSILAFTAPIPNSYDRIQPNTWSGAYRCWGNENREAPLRASCPPGIAHGFISNFEIKSFDGCANPHLGLAAIVAAGIDGLRRHLSLPEPINTNPAELNEKVERLPTSLSESVEALDKDSVLENLLGENLLVTIKAVRKAEIGYYANNKEAYRQLIHRY